MSGIDIRDLVPGGIKPTDHVHVHTNDDTCSRCRRAIAEDDVPLMAFLAGDSMLIFCRDCLAEAPEGGPRR